MFSFFYDLALGLYLLLSLPKIFLNLKKYRSTIKERLFFNKKDFSIPPNAFVVWIHAVSLGETKAIISLASKIKKENENVFLIISSITKTGHNEALSSIPADKHIYLPIDFSFLMKRALNFLKPRLVIIVESDLWYNFLRFSKKNNAKIILVNGKLSLKSCKRYKMLSFYAKRIFSNFDLFCLQNDTFKSRFENLALSLNNLHVTGNLKFDNKPDFLAKEDLLLWKKRFKINDQDRVITLASTHDPEEKLLLPLLNKHKIFLAPRHPERIAKVQNILKEMNVSFCLLSNIDNLKDEKVILVDKMGFLNTCYQLSDLAIVGGSFIPKVGGHNILEPVFVNVPVFFGPYMWSQIELRDYTIRAKCGRQITLETVEKEIEKYYLSAKKEMKNNCKILKDELSGQMEKTYSHIKNIL